MSALAHVHVPAHAPACCACAARAAQEAAELAAMDAWMDAREAEMLAREDAERIAAYEDEESGRWECGPKEMW